MQIQEYTYPEQLYYDQNHFWAKIEDGLVVLGATDLTQKMAGEVSFVEAAPLGEELKQGQAFGSMESGKWVGRLYAPVSGKVAAVNAELEDHPEIINEDCYGRGWIMKIEPSDVEAELPNLMQGKDYRAWIEAQLNEECQQ
jgi:glycine cleavage system H protein